MWISKFKVKSILYIVLYFLRLLIIIVGGTGYVNHVAYQDPRLNIVCYNVMLEAIKNMMGKFQEANGGALPEKLVWYRGGASTGSYQQILKNETKGNFYLLPPRFTTF